MPNKCGIFNCKGNYNTAEKCRVFKLPSDTSQREVWINALPPREGFEIDPAKFFICQRHWPEDVLMKKIPGGYTVPAVPPSIFNVPPSCLPTPRPSPRPAKDPERHFDRWKHQDKITSFEDFDPVKDLKEEVRWENFDHIIISRSIDKLVFVFMLGDFSGSYMTVIVHNIKTLTCPLTLSAYKDGERVPFGKSQILQPNNGLSSYSAFFAALNFARNFSVPVFDMLRKTSETLKDIENREAESAVCKSQVCLNSSNLHKLSFLRRQIELLCSKSYTVSDYCLAVESYPRCSYSLLSEFLTLPSKRKVQAVVSSSDIDTVLTKTFTKINHPMQRNCMLLVDEVKIRPTVSYSAGVLNGMAKNNPESRASSMLWVMMKCLHGGPSLMISVTPVHRLTADFQYDTVLEAAHAVEKAGGVVLGSMTDNHKIKQQYCKLFNLNDKSISKADHPLDPEGERKWWLLYDSVHLLKCIRNNWITEKCQTLSLDNKIGTFADVKELYDAEKDSILKTTRLTNAAVNPSKLQLQNVLHVLRVFSDKVVAALKLKKRHATAMFIQLVLDWWNMMNVFAAGQDIRLRDPSRAVQTAESSNLKMFYEVFLNSESGQGPKRIQCLTHDTKKALVQTLEGMQSLCEHLFTLRFQYVLLRELQSDRIEGEFSVYRQSTGGNAFMLSGDVYNCYKKRMTRFSASFLQFVETQQQSTRSHECCGVTSDDAAAIESCMASETLSGEEENSAAYVFKCAQELCFSEEEPTLSSVVQQFIEEVSRGALKVPHACTFELVRAGLCFVKHNKHNTCCRQKLMDVLTTLSTFFDINITSKQSFQRLANVLLSGLQNLEKDHQKNLALYQTSIKKARLAD